MNKIVAIIFIFLKLIIYGQEYGEIDYSENIVSNYSFEEHGDIKCERMEIGDYVNFNIDSWTWASNSSPDIFSTELDKQCYSYSYKNNISEKTISTQYGSIIPRTGKIMLGIYVTGIYKYKEYHEYLKTRLKKPLLPKQKYYVEFWVCRSVNSKFASNNIGALFSKNNIFYDNIKPIFDNPQINHEDVINENDKWVKISGYFFPDDTLRYMIIGNFYTDKQSKVRTFNEFLNSDISHKDSYYLIDDVFVSCAGDTPEESHI